ncbi:cell division control protein [Histoplasma ohiense]|nr:cell division control protein [Histoplasma ohiense (nom. inval.)]
MSQKSLSQYQFPPASGVPPPSPQTARTLRRYQSHQSLSSHSPTFPPQPRPTLQRNAASHRERTEEHAGYQNVLQPVSATTRTRARTRSNSDVTSNSITSIQQQPQHGHQYQPHKRPTSGRKSGSLGLQGKKSGLDALLRDGPPGGNIADGLQDLRYLVLSSRVDSDSDGMSPHRIYLWLALLNVAPLPTDEYLSLVHRGRSPAYTKIRNDTFRTLATDPLFKRRVTEASLIRLLNAVAWKIHDSKETTAKLPLLSQQACRPGDPSPEPSPSTTDGFSSAPCNTPSTTSHTASEPAIYVQGMNVLCAPFLYASRSEVEAFALFHYFIIRECPGYVRGTMDGVHKGLKLVDRCLEVVEPKLANHLFSRGMYAELYAFPSVLTLCACTPPLPEVLHLWDFLFAYGPHLNILCIVAQLIRLRDTILASPSPNKILRSLPALDAKEIIALTVLIVRKIPDNLYEELVTHAQ